ncbi:MAG: type IV pilin protein [Steroidobacteraceae bacterium]
MATRSGSLLGHDAGFTLIELMVTIVIAAILLSIAVPSYMNQIRKSRRTEARTAVLDLATREERYLSTANVYSQTPGDLGYGGAFPQSVGSGYYTLTVAVPDPAYAGPAGTSSYIITATATGSQLKDTPCRTFSVNEVGQQTASDASNGVSTTTCWGN